MNPERESERREDSGAASHDSLCTSDSPLVPSHRSVLSHMHETQAFCPVCTYSSVQRSH